MLQTIWLFAQKLTQDNNKETSEDLHFWLLVLGIWWIPYTKGQ